MYLRANAKVYIVSKWMFFWKNLEHSLIKV